MPTVAQEPAHEPQRPAKNLVHPNRSAGGRPPTNVAALRELQASAGNRAVSQMLASRAGPVHQRTLAVESDEYSAFVREQEQKQHAVLEGQEREPFTTVGFEHEFCGHEGPLQGVSHLTVATADQPLPYTNLSFAVETDAANVFELVTPPFLLPVKDAATPVPKADQVEKVVGLAHQALGQAAGTHLKLPDLLINLRKFVGPDFTLADGALITAENLSHHSKLKPGRLQADELSSIDIVPMTKHHGSIATQVNFATNFAVFNKLVEQRRELVGPDKVHRRDVYREIEERLSASIDPAKTKQTILDECERLMIITIAGQLATFMQQLLTGYLRDRGRPASDLFRATLEQLVDEDLDPVRRARFADALFKGKITKKAIAINLGKNGKRVKEDDPLVEQIFYQYQLRVPTDQALSTAGLLSSHVKDVYGVWPKDTWENVISGGLLGPWRALALKLGIGERKVAEYLHTAMIGKLIGRLERNIRPAVEKIDLTDLLKDLPWPAGLLAQDVKAQMRSAVNTMSALLAHDFLNVLAARGQLPHSGDVAELMRPWFGEDPRRNFGEPPQTAQPGLYGHDPARVSARQDTHLDPAQVQKPAQDQLGFGHLFVVESRGDVDTFIKVLGEL
ncbi:hypothetical protein Q5425_39160 [Amycolatopsis sp. A133]|uniref:hypothetical protein n=1 Tax=Amycolatopsis sp. A133 TaxID=3064472 RepID=UPI0027FCC623|nr:hypothetical protein [Amycolatopsis sp. A133]MDQ7809781.1 hypothetical protein [Amycolatopsis sp. A133]